ncbi:MAG: Gfo/Idh/MocA family oxidoreductase [Armatimonadota bacterium]|nr:Gfo/Idh/MocA family oxidoreductase [Armatimonadota bacterium]
MLRVGVVGLASAYWPVALARCVQSYPGAELVAAAHLGRSEHDLRVTVGMSAEEYAARFGVRLYHDAAEMIRQEGLHACLIQEQHSRIVRLVEEAAGLGVHLYIAKPMAVRLEDAERIVAATRRAGVVAVSGMTERMDGAIRAVYQRVRDGAVGEVLTLRALHQHGHYNFHPEDWWGLPEEGGPQLSLMWYTGDVVSWFAGSRPRRVYAEYENFISPHQPFFDQGKALIRFENGVIASCDIYFSCRWRFPFMEIEVVGSKGILRTRQDNYEALLFTERGTEVFYRAENDRLREEVHNWLAACQGKGEAFITIEEARDAIALCLACRESAQTGQAVALPG